MTTNTFTYTPLSSPDSIRLVSILPGAYGAPLQCTIAEYSYGDVPAYECLSYAWGPPDLLGNSSIDVNGHSFAVSQELDLAIRRLRREPPGREAENGCENEQIRLVWIDALCINQSDILERNAQVSRMAEIYRGAWQVVAWIGAESEDSSLAIKFLRDMSLWSRADRFRDADQVSVDSELSDAARVDDGQPEEEDVEEVAYEHGRLEFVENDGDRGSTNLDHDEVGEETAHDGLEDDGSDGKASSTHLLAEEEVVSTISHVSSASEDYDGQVWSQSSSWLGTGTQFVLRILSSPFRRWWATLDWHTQWEWEQRWDRFKEWTFHPISTWKTQRAFAKLIKAYEAESEENFKRAGHQLSGVPILHHEFPLRDVEPFFRPQYAASWDALDNLFARPWWSRTWVVQEVWNAEKTILQCGADTLRWAHVEESMSFCEAFDDMGYYVRETPRWASWDRLKRRYGLAIHIAQKRLHGANLSDLLWNMWDREATDPRDKVYAVFGLVGEAVRARLPAVDYARSTRQVYTEAAVSVMQQERSLDILLAASGPSNRHGLPSWVPDWRREANAQRPALFINGSRMRILLYFSGSARAVFFHGHGYSASGKSEPIVRLDEETATLRVGGVVLNTISVAGHAWGSDAESASIIEDASSTLVRSSAVLSSSTSGQDLRCVLRAGSYFSRGEDQVIENIMRQRRFFVTEKGILGIGPAALLPGDHVVIIAGCNFPMVLRAQGSSYVVVGEAYGK